MIIHWLLSIFDPLIHVCETISHRNYQIDFSDHDVPRVWLTSHHRVKLRVRAETLHTSPLLAFITKPLPIGHGYSFCLRV